MEFIFFIFYFFAFYSEVERKCLGQDQKDHKPEFELRSRKAQPNCVSEHYMLALTNYPSYSVT